MRGGSPGRDTVWVVRRRLTRVVQLALLAGSAGFVVAVMAGSPGQAGAVQGASTTRCTPALCGVSTTAPVATTSAVTSPPTTAPVRTTPPTTAAPRTVAPSRQTYPTSLTTVPSSTTTATTIPGIGGHLPVAASTLPFTTKQQSSHVSPVFAALSGAGFFVALLIMGVRFVLSRPPKP